MKSLLFALFLIGFVLIIQALDQSYHKKLGHTKTIKQPEFLQ